MHMKVEPRRRLLNQFIAFRVHIELLYISLNVCKKKLNHRLVVVRRLSHLANTCAFCRHVSAADHSAQKSLFYSEYRIFIRSHNCGARIVTENYLDVSQIAIEHTEWCKLNDNTFHFFLIFCL